MSMVTNKLDSNHKSFSSNHTCEIMNVSARFVQCAWYLIDILNMNRIQYRPNAKYLNVSESIFITMSYENSTVKMPKPYACILHTTAGKIIVISYVIIHYHYYYY